MLPHYLGNFEIQKCYHNHAERRSKNETRFDGVNSIDNLPKINNGAYIINIDEYSDIGANWIALYIQSNDITYFDRFEVENIPEEIKGFIGNKNIKINIFRVQAYDSIMCGYFYIRLINFMLLGKTLTYFTNLFSKNNF